VKFATTFRFLAREYSEKPARRQEQGRWDFVVERECSHLAGSSLINLTKPKHERQIGSDTPLAFLRFPCACLERKAGTLLIHPRRDVSGSTRRCFDGYD
jgi:hypothetical protein